MIVADLFNYKSIFDVFFVEKAVILLKCGIIAIGTYKNPKPRIAPQRRVQHRKGA